MVINSIWIVSDYNESLNKNTTILAFQGEKEAKRLFESLSEIWVKRGYEKKIEDDGKTIRIADHVIQIFRDVI